MEYRNILPLGRTTAVIHLRDGGRSQVVHRPLAKSSNIRKLLEFKHEFIDQKAISSRLLGVNGSPVYSAIS
jgi:hypothetical protein